MRSAVKWVMWPRLRPFQMLFIIHWLYIFSTVNLCTTFEKHIKRCTYLQVADADRAASIDEAPAYITSANGYQVTGRPITQQPSGKKYIATPYIFEPQYYADVSIK